VARSTGKHGNYCRVIEAALVSIHFTPYYNLAVAQSNHSNTRPRGISVILEWHNYPGASQSIKSFHVLVVSGHTDLIPCSKTPNVISSTVIQVRKTLFTFSMLGCSNHALFQNEH
jgi:hypothetical protein